MFTSKEFEEGFIKGSLFGPKVVGVFYRGIHCSVAVIYKFDGSLMDAQVFNKDGNQIK